MSAIEHGGGRDRKMSKEKKWRWKETVKGQTTLMTVTNVNSPRRVDEEILDIS